MSPNAAANLVQQETVHVPISQSDSSSVKALEMATIMRPISIPRRNIRLSSRSSETPDRVHEIAPFLGIHRHSIASDTRSSSNGSVLPVFQARSRKRLLRQFTDRTTTTSSSGLIQLPKLDLRTVLADRTKQPVTLVEYKIYLETVEFGSEALDFYLAVEQLKTYKDDLLLAISISQVVNTFITIGSPFEINVTNDK